jgi:hypothetical protein
MNIMKFLMVGINVIFWAIGGTMLGVGIWLAVDPTAFDSINIASSAGMNDDLWAAAVYTMIGVGAGVFLIGFLGCFGAIKADDDKSNIMLKIYFGFVLLILIAEIVCIILIAVFWTSIDDTVKDEMVDDLKYHYKGEEAEDGISTSWNNMQTRWDCCGANSYLDYKGSNYSLQPGQPVVPWTCCTKQQDGGDKPLDPVIAACRLEAEQAVIPSTTIYLNLQGCYHSLVQFIDQNAAIIIGVTCGFIGLQIVGLVFACCLMYRDSD